MIAIVGMEQGTRAHTALTGWLRDTGIDPASVFYCSVPKWSKAPRVAEVRDYVARVASELAATMPEVVIAIGGMGVRVDTDLWSGGISRCHGRSGTAEIGDGKYPAIACYHPNFALRQNDPRRRMETENSIKLVLSRALHLNDAVVEHAVTVVAGRAYVNERIGLDFETTQDEEKRKLITRGKVDARASTLKMGGLADGRLTYEGVDFGPDAEPIIYNHPFDAVIAGAWAPRWHDPKMLAHLIGEKDTEMKSLAMRWLGRPLSHYKDVANTDKEPAYCVADAYAHQAILDEGYRRAPAGVLNVYENIERPMMPLYARWTMDGIWELDRARAERIAAAQQDEIATLAARLRAEHGITNPNSKEQVAAMAYGWDKASGTPTPSVDVKALESRKHMPGVALTLAYRQKAKAYSTYVGAWLRWPLPKIGTLWRPCGAWTGRPSSVAINAQNIPPGLRDLLTPPPGKRHRCFDNAQLEVRIAAHLSGDRNMRAVFVDGAHGGDIHGWACTVIGTKVRTFGKIGVFGTLFGGSEAAVTSQAPRFGMTIDEVRPHARAIVAAIPRMFPDFMTWANKVAALPVVPGLFGARLIPPPNGDAGHVRREKINCSIQRGGVDVVKLQTIALERAGFRTVHMIHDEVIIELDEADDTEDTRRTAAEVMEHAVTLDVPLKVESKLWGKAA